MRFLEYFLLFVFPDCQRMEVEIDLEKITGRVKHVPFRRKPLIWSVKIRDFHKKLRSHRILVAKKNKNNFFSENRRFSATNRIVFYLNFVYIGLRGNYKCNKQESHL